LLETHINGKIRERVLGFVVRRGLSNDRFVDEARGVYMLTLGRRMTAAAEIGAAA
jgi:hypothetical protein